MNTFNTFKTANLWRTILNRNVNFKKQLSNNIKIGISAKIPRFLKTMLRNKTDKKCSNYHTNVIH